MSTLERMPLELAIPIIEKLFPSIVVKTLFLKNNDEWLNLFTMIFPTRKTVLDLKKENDNLENKIGKINFENIKVIFQARNAKDLSKIINEIEKGYFKVGELNAKFIQSTSKIKQQQFRYSSFNKYGELSEYESFSLMCGVQQNVSNTLIEYGISPKLFGLDSFDDLARSWFNVEVFDYAINVLIIIPVYAKIISLSYEGGKSIKIDLKIDESIIKNSQLILIRRGGEDRSPILERKFYDIYSYQNTKYENFFFVQIKNEFLLCGFNRNF